MKWTLALIMLSSSAHAADPQYCRVYSRGALTMAVGQIAPKERAQLTMSKLHDLLSRLQGSCGNLEEDAVETDTIWLVDLLDQIKRDPAAAVSPPAAGVPPAPKHAPAAAPPTPPPAVPPTSKAKTPAQICGAAHLKVVFKGKSWRCK